MDAITTSKSPESIVIQALKKYSPDQLIEADAASLKEVHLSIAKMFVEVDQQKAIEAKKNVNLIKILGEVEVLKIYIVILKYFSHSIKVSEKMSTIDIVEIAMEYVKTYSYNSVKDFILLLKNIRTAKYGPIFNRLDISVFFEFMNKYEENKCKFLENLNKSYRDTGSSIEALFINCPEHIINKYEEELDAIPNAELIKQKAKERIQWKKIYSKMDAEKLLNNEKI